MTLLTDHLRLGPAIFRGKTYSPQQLMRQVDAVARYLDARCRGRSPIVYLFATNHVKTLAGYFGILKSGRVCLLADPACGALEWEEMTHDAPPSAVIRFDEVSDVLDLEREATLYDNVLDRDGVRELDNVCTLLFTAADDGYGKAAMLTHENMLANGRSVVECSWVDEGTTCCSLIPFHHLFGLQTGLIGPALCGAATCLCSVEYLRSLTGTVHQLQAAKVTRICCVPVGLYLLGKAFASAGGLASSVRVASGGAKLPHQVREYYLRRFGAEIYEGYGLTEAAPICAWHRLEDSIRSEAVGRAFTCCELRIEDDSGAEVPPGTVGEVCVRGANVMKGYFLDTLRTSAAVRQGWLHTGDMGRIDADGFLYLVGLRKRMLNVGGKKVYPAEVERLMRRHPNVARARIFGRALGPYGEAVSGDVELRAEGTAEESEFLAWCSLNISGFKLPRRIQFGSRH